MTRSSTSVQMAGNDQDCVATQRMEWVGDYDRYRFTIVTTTSSC